jgi:hypothetical protein
MAVPARYGLSGQSNLAQMPWVVWLASMPQPVAMARTMSSPRCPVESRAPVVHGPLSSSTSIWAFVVEPVTGTEPALSAWESDRSVSLVALSGAVDAPPVTVMDPAAPGLMAR